MGLQAGINAYQDFGGTRRFSRGDNDISLEPREKIGFVGGMKAGYVFGTGTVRPAIEADLYYNGVQADIDARVNGNDVDFNAEPTCTAARSWGTSSCASPSIASSRTSAAASAATTRRAQDVESDDRGTGRFDGGGGSNSGFAWQLIGGADYYFTEKFSAFLEYKFLNYEDAGFNEDSISQHLVVLGLRWHF